MPNRILTQSAAWQAGFWSKVDRRGLNECWPWLGTTLAKTGRGQVYLPLSGAKYPPRVYAPVVAWVLTNGRPVPPGQVVCHTCDNPNCANPNHLFSGTQGDNVRDAIRKGRRNAFGRQKLTETDVLAIRRRGAAGERHAHIAQDYGLRRHSVCAILNRHSWKHLPVETRIRSESIPAVALERVHDVQIQLRGEVA